MRNLAILDPLSLEGQEIRRKLEQKRHLWHELKLLSIDPEEDGSLTESDGAAALVGPYEAGALDTADLVIAPAEQYSAIADDLLPSTRVVLFGPAGDATDLDLAQPVVYGVNHATDTGSPIQLSPAPSVIALSHIGASLRDLGLRRLAATFVYPVSIRGGAALDELFDQTRQLLNFNPNPTTPLLGHQVAFNIVPAGATGYRAEHQVSTILGFEGEFGPSISIQSLLGGVFHGVSMSIFLDFDDDPGEGQILEMLEENSFVEIVEDPSTLGPIDTADREEILIGELAASRPGSYRLWAVFDNLTRGSASNIVELAEVLLTER